MQKKRTGFCGQNQDIASAYTVGDMGAMSGVLNLGAIMPRLVARMDDSLILQQPVAKKDNSEKVPQPATQLEGSG